MENKISVIVTTYNQANTIGRTLDSILGQQCSWPVEIVLGEDGSTDGTRAVCQRYAQKNPDCIRLLGNGTNKGLIDNYFDCLLQCKGKYIADCAGDDFWTDKHKLEKELQVMEAHPEVTIVHTEWLRYDESAKTTSEPPPTLFPAPFTDGKQMLSAIVTQTTRPVVHLCSAMYRAETILQAYHEDTYMFRNKDFGCEDLQIVAALAYAGTVAYLPEVTLHYSIGHTSVSVQPDDARQFDFVRKVTNLSYYLAQKYHISDTDTNSYFRYRVFALTMHAFRAHDTRLLSEALACEKMWNARRTCTVRAMACVMRHEWLWTVALKARHLFVCAKQLFR